MRKREERVLSREVKHGGGTKARECYRGSEQIPAGLLHETSAIVVLVSWVYSEPRVMLLLQVR